MAARSEVQSKRIERTTMQSDHGTVGSRPAEPGGREAEGARVRNNRHFLGRKAADQGNAGAITEGIPARQHGNVPTALSSDHIDRAFERAFPEERSAQPDGIIRR